MAVSYYSTKIVSLNGAGATAISTNIDATAFPAPVDAGYPEIIEVQAVLITNPTFFVLVAMDRVPSIDDFDACLAHGASAHMIPTPAGTIQCLLLNAAGAASNGGSKDRVMYRGAKGRQVG